MLIARLPLAFVFRQTDCFNRSVPTHLAYRAMRPNVNRSGPHRTNREKPSKSSWPSEFESVQAPLSASYLLIEADGGCSKLHNLESIRRSPPVGWGLKRIQAYFIWAKQVTDSESNLELESVCPPGLRPNGSECPWLSAETRN